MDIKKLFKPKFFKAADLDDEPITMAISEVEIAEFGTTDKPILFFDGDERGLVLNKTNSRALGTAYGNETDTWIGKRVILFQTKVDFQGSTVGAIRVKIPRA